MGNIYAAIRIDYDNVVTYTETDNNVVGASNTTTLRTIETHDDTNCIYLNKTGSDGNPGTLVAPKLTLGGAETACDASHQMITITDSRSYDEEVTFNNANCLRVQADLGQAPRITHGCGARDTSTPIVTAGTVYYVMKTGDDANTGLSEAQAFLTIGQATATVASGDSIVVADSGTYVEDILFTSDQDVRFIAKAGETPTIQCSNDAQGIRWAVGFIAKTFYMDGFIISYSGSGHAVSLDSTAVPNSNCYLYNCTIVTTASLLSTKAAVWVVEMLNTGIYNCHIYSSVGGAGYGLYVSGVSTNVTVFDNLIHGYSSGMGVRLNSTGTAANNDVYDNVVYDCWWNIYVTHDSNTDNTEIQRCTSYDGQYCYYVNRIAGDTVTVNGCIARRKAGATDFHFSINTTVTYCLYTYAAASSTTAGAGCIDGTPDFCDDVGNYYGLRPDSNGWHVGDAAGTVDMGPRWNVVEVDINSITFSGLRIEGNGQWIKGVTHYDEQTGTRLEWCSVSQLTGMAVDYYCTTSSACVTANSLVHHAGGGIAEYGGNTLEYSCVYKNAYHGVYSAEALEYVNHVVSYGNTYGFYFDSGSSASEFKNTATSQNAAFGIYSDSTEIVVTYSCIADGYNANVNVTSETNLFIAPNFRNIADGSEDFHLATVAGGYIFPESEDNPLIDAGESDIGAYSVDRAVADDTWSSYTLPHNPVRLDFQRIPINPQERFDTDGTYRRHADKFQWLLTFTWPDDYDIGDELPRYMEYLFQLNTEIRIFLDPPLGLWQGNVIVDRTNMRLTPSGYPLLIPDQWKSWWFEIDGITTPFKIVSNTNGYWQLADPDDALPANGTYAAVITFIRTKNRLQTAVAPVQKYYIKDEDGNEIPRNGFKIRFIEY